MSFSVPSLPAGLKRFAWVGVIVLGAAAIWLLVQHDKDKGERQESATITNEKSHSRPALTVIAITPHSVEWPQLLISHGNIAAWQEAVISTEIGNLRLVDVRVNVGDHVQHGQVLARISDDTLTAELAQTQAAVSEAEAMLAEARANGDRARQFQQTGFMSAQQVAQYLTAEKTAFARLNAARARKQSDQLRLAQTLVRAPDSGVISARTATLGSLAQPGQELFRLIRGARLEWRAEVSAADLGKLKPGMAATLITPNGIRVQGRVRMVAPTVDPKTLNGLVYVDLPVSETGNSLRAGTFARGEFALGHVRVMSLPQSAVVMRDGFSYVFRLDDINHPEKFRVAQTKVQIGQRRGDQIEIVSGLEPDARVVARGAGFLADGDAVRVVAASSVSAQ